MESSGTRFQPPLRLRYPPDPPPAARGSRITNGRANLSRFFKVAGRDFFQFNMFPKLFPAQLHQRPQSSRVLFKNENFSFSILEGIIKKRYTPPQIALITQMFHFIEPVYLNKKRRDDGNLAIVHPLAVAIRAARSGATAEDVCAALGHDLFEDTNKLKNQKNKVTPQDILNFFSGDPFFEHSAAKIIDTIIFLTKPHYIESTKEWVFADDPRYYEMDDEYYKESLDPNAEESLFDDLNEAYYRGYGTHKGLLNSGRISTIYLKELDHIHNAESSRGVDETKYMRVMRTMARYGMRPSGIFFVGPDRKYIAELFQSAGIDIGRSVTPTKPSQPVVTFKFRSRFEIEDLQKHPDPHFAYTIVYSREVDTPVILATDSIEIGLPSRLGLKYNFLLRKYIGNRFNFDPENSALPSSSPLHEEIFRIYGFTPLKERQRVIRRSEKRKDVFEILGEAGDITNYIPTHKLSKDGKNEIPFGPTGMELLRKVEIAYYWLIDQLTELYKKEISDALKNHPANNPPKDNS